MSETHKPKRVRSPSYPSVDLEVAIEKLKIMYEFTHLTPVLVSVMLLRWGFESGKSANGMKLVSAIKSYGLIDDTGKKENRQIEMSDKGFKLINLVEDSEERANLVKEIALMPEMYRYMWDTYQDPLPHFDSIKSHLVLEKKFNGGAVKGFLDDYSKTIEYANLTKDDKDKDDELNPPPQVEIGDMIQWESQGVLQFKEPKKVVSFKQEDGYVFVEGHQARIPVGEVIIKEPPRSDNNAGNWANGGNILTQSGNVPPLGVPMRHETFALDNGDVVIQWPSSMSKDSFEDFSDWLEILKRKAKRSIQGVNELKTKNDNSIE